MRGMLMSLLSSRLQRGRFFVVSADLRCIPNQGGSRRDLRANPRSTARKGVQPDAKRSPADERTILTTLFLCVMKVVCNTWRCRRTATGLGLASHGDQSYCTDMAGDGSGRIIPPQRSLTWP